MKKFLEDYWDLCKHSGRFCKNHWKGIIVFTMVYYGALAGGLAVKNKIDEKKTQKLMDEVK